MKVAMMLAAIVGAVYFVIEWAAVFGHCPESYHCMIQWPWPPIGATASLLTVFVCIISQVHDENEAEKMQKQLEEARNNRGR